ncbi:hypothetical protein D9M71_388790 [compost metagenome]
MADFFWPLYDSVWDSPESSLKPDRAFHQSISLRAVSLTFSFAFFAPALILLTTFFAIATALSTTQSMALLIGLVMVVMTLFTCLAMLPRPSTEANSEISTGTERARAFSTASVTLAKLPAATSATASYTERMKSLICW